jgi:hypothetical protein
MNGDYSAGTLFIRVILKELAQADDVARAPGRGRVKRDAHIKVLKHGLIE